MATTGTDFQLDRRDDQPPRIGGQTTGQGHFAGTVNVPDRERAASALAGGGLVLYGLMRGALGGWALAGLGAALAWRGLTGHCGVYQRLGIDRASGDGGTLTGNLGVKVDRSIVVATTPDRVWGIWRNFENLPRFMSHVDKVELLDRTRSRWTVKAPGGLAVTWDAEIINEIPNELIAWRSTRSTLVQHAGSVRFERAPDGRSTTVRVSLQYDPPGGELGHALLRLIGQNADDQVAQDLIAFKRAIEAGELAA
jgi:uncharacterized membrane protein